MTVDMQFRLRIRNAADSADALVVTSTRGGTNPWLSSVPSGDGLEFDPLTGHSRAGAFTGRIADGITSGTDRIVTSQLEDANLRQQLMDRKAFVEYTINGGSTWPALIPGYLTALRLANDAEYEYTVSDPTRVEHDAMAFKPKPNPANPATLEPIADYLTRWPNRGCIFGGPIIGGFLDQPDRGGWEMKVEANSGGVTFLRFVAGYGPPDFDRSTNAEDCMAAARERTDGLLQHPTDVSPVTTFEQAEHSTWRGVVVEVLTTTGTSLGYFLPDTGLRVSGADVINGGQYKHLLKDIRNRGLYVYGTSLTTGSTIRRVRGFTPDVSDLSPIYWTGHPIDLLTKLWDEAGLAYNSTAVTNTKNAIGADRRISLRITEYQPLGDFLEQVVYGPFGVGVRVNDSGQLVPFSGRIPYNANPSTTITSADVWTDADGAGPELFAIEQASAVNKVIFEHTRLVKTQDGAPSDEDLLRNLFIEAFGTGPQRQEILGKQVRYNTPNPDGFSTVNVRFERTNGDAGAVGKREVTFSVPAMVHTNGTNQDDQLPKYVDALAQEIFDRWGRGIITCSAQGLRGGSTDSTLLGDEVLVQLPALPNHNKRLVDDPSVSARAMQITHYTWTPRGPLLGLSDSGPNAQPFATAPTLSIGASSAFPRTVAEVTVTNAATLNAAGAGLRLQMAVTTGSTPAATDYTDVAAFVAGSIPTGAIQLPAVIAGRKVYARAAATKVGSRPSSWSTAVSVTLSGINAVSSLTASTVAGDGSTEQLTWTAGDTTSVLDIFIRASGAAAADAIRLDTIPAGSTRYLLQGLTPGAAYTASVQARDQQTGDVSARVDVTFTTSATATTLPAPVYPFGFAGTLGPDGVPQRDEVYGIGVVAADYPGFVEAAVAVETAVGSGSYGSFVVSGTLVASVLGNWTIWQDMAANDGLRRQIKARHVREGATSSAYTAIVTVLPWTPQALPPLPTAVIVEATLQAPTEPGINIIEQVTGIDPAGQTMTVRLKSKTANVSVVTGSAVGTYTTNGSTWKLSQPEPGAGPGAATFEALTTDGRTGQAIITIPEQTTLAQPQGTVAIDADGNWEATADGPSNAVSFKYATSTSSFPSDASVASTGSVFTGARTFTITGGPLTFGQTIYITIIPYNAGSGTGTALPSIHLRGAYLTYTASKTLSYAGSNWMLWDPVNTNWSRNGNGQPVNNAFAFPYGPIGSSAIALPAGVALVQADFSYVWNSATTKIDVWNYFVVLNNSTLNFGAANYAGGAQVRSVSLSSTTFPSGQALFFYFQWGPPATGTTDASQATAGDFSVTYTMTDPKKTV